MFDTVYLLLGLYEICGYDGEHKHAAQELGCGFIEKMRWNEMKWVVRVASSIKERPSPKGEKTQGCLSLMGIHLKGMRL